jgi:hypothetical protein
LSKEALKELFEWPPDDIQPFEQSREFRTEPDPEIKDWPKYCTSTSTSTYTNTHTLTVFVCVDTSIIVFRIRDDPKLPPHVRDCVDFYTMSWRGYVRRYCDCGLHRPPEFDQSLPPLTYEDPTSSLSEENKKLTKKNSKSGVRSQDKKETSSCDVIRAELLEPYNPKLTDSLNQKTRVHFFSSQYLLSHIN